MKINFTNKEFRTLLDLIYLGNWVINANEIEPEKNLNKHEELVQKIYSHAKDFNFENLVEYNNEFKEYIETAEFEDSEVSEYLEEYEEQNFWETLISRLAERDFLLEIPRGSLNDLSLEEKFIKIQKHEDKWTEEFSKFGIDNLEIKKETQQPG